MSTSAGGWNLKQSWGQNPNPVTLHAGSPGSIFTTAWHASFKCVNFSKTYTPPAHVGVSHLDCFFSLPTASSTGRSALLPIAQEAFSFTMCPSFPSLLNDNYLQCCLILLLPEERTSKIHRKWNQKICSFWSRKIFENHAHEESSQTSWKMSIIKKHVFQKF